jgi:D-alanine-D-alanine ligase
MKILVMFGSRSTEHDVSIISALTVYKALEETKKYELSPLYIKKDGSWELGGNLDDIKAHRKNIAKGVSVSVLFDKTKTISLKENKFLGKTHTFDLVIPIFHGLNGEDGSVQGLLELAQVPYTGSSVLGSVLGMDKIIMKDVLKSYNLPIVPYLFLTRNEFLLQGKSILKKITDKLKFPIYVKPANLGSSIGINKTTNLEELENAIEVASFYDERIICEEGIEELQEINCAVRSKENKIETSLLEEPITYKDFLSFEEKYINQGGTMHGVKSKVKIPAVLPNPSLATKIENTSKQIFKIFNLKGVIRIDYLINLKNNEVFINEINTIPGSLQYHLWEKSGVSFTDLLEDLIKEAIFKEKEKIKSSFAFTSEILLSGNMKK